MFRWLRLPNLLLFRSCLGLRFFMFSINLCCLSLEEWQVVPGRKTPIAVQYFGTVYPHSSHGVVSEIKDGRRHALKVFILRYPHVTRKIHAFTNLQWHIL